MATTSLNKLYQIFTTCNGITTDSRQCPAGSLFFALHGKTFDGNAYAAQALKAGCAYVVVDNPTYAVPDGKRYLFVDDTLHTLQQLARLHRRTLGTRLIGITGTNGKTTTKELIAAVLSRRFRVHYTQGNLNNAIGVPLTLLRLRPKHEIGIIEMGASHLGDIRELVEIAEPDYGIVTNVGKAHLEGFGSPEGVIQTKKELFDFLRHHMGKRATVFVHADAPHLTEMAHDLAQVTYGKTEGNDICGHATNCSPYLHLVWKAKGETVEHKIATQLIGDYNLPNVLAAVTIGHYFGVPTEEIDCALGEYKPTNNRSQLLQTADNTLIIDAYNANPTSMRAAIGNFCRMGTQNKMLILGDMGELGAKSKEEHREIAAYIAECGFKDVVFVGSQFAAVQQQGFPTYPTTSALIEDLKKNKPRGKTILIKGSNFLRLSDLSVYL